MKDRRRRPPECLFARLPQGFFALLDQVEQVMVALNDPVGFVHDDANAGQFAFTAESNELHGLASSHQLGVLAVLGWGWGQSQGAETFGEVVVPLVPPHFAVFPHHWFAVVVMNLFDVGVQLHHVSGVFLVVAGDVVARTVPDRTPKQLPSQCVETVSGLGEVADALNFPCVVVERAAPLQYGDAVVFGVAAQEVAPEPPVPITSEIRKSRTLVRNCTIP